MIYFLCFSSNSFNLTLRFEKVGGPRLLCFRLIHVRNDYILIFQIFHDATSKDLRPRQIFPCTNRVAFGIRKAVAGSDIFNVVLLFSIIDSKVSQQIRPNQSSQGRSAQGTTDASAEFFGLIHKPAPSLFYLSF
jgi:hypothetical protein